MRNIVVVLCLLVVFGCGVKTDPVAKETLPADSVTDVQIINTAYGIDITNGNSYQPLQVTRFSSDTDTKPATFTIQPKTTFTDTSVQKGAQYRYRFAHFNPMSQMQGSTRDIMQTYALPPVVKGLEVIPVPDAFQVIIYAVDAARFGVRSSNGFFAETLNPGVSIPVDKAGVYEVSVTPYDRFGNAGTTLVATATHEGFVPLNTPEHVRVELFQTSVLISWDSVDGASSYEIAKDTEFVTETALPYYRFSPLPTKCSTYTITAAKGHNVSRPAAVTVCPK